MFFNKNISIGPVQHFPIFSTMYPTYTPIHPHVTYLRRETSFSLTTMLGWKIENFCSHFLNVQLFKNTFSKCYFYVRNKKKRKTMLYNISKACQIVQAELEISLIKVVTTPVWETMVALPDSSRGFVKVLDALRRGWEAQECNERKKETEGLGTERNSGRIRL